MTDAEACRQVIDGEWLTWRKVARHDRPPYLCRREVDCRELGGTDRPDPGRGW